MISPSHEVEEFVREVKGGNHLDIISSAIKEATEAERKYYQHNRYSRTHREHSRDYANALKELVDFLRYSTKPHSSRFDGLDLSIFLSEERALRPRFDSLPH